MNKYEVVPTKFFLKQLSKLNVKTIKKIQHKLQLLEENPFRNKTLIYQKYKLLRIRLTDINKEIRVIYTLNKQEVLILFILDRNNDYKDLEKYIKKLEKELEF